MTTGPSDLTKAFEEILARISKDVTENSRAVVGKQENGASFETPSHVLWITFTSEPAAVCAVIKATEKFGSGLEFDSIYELGPRKEWVGGGFLLEQSPTACTLEDVLVDLVYHELLGIRRNDRGGMLN